MAPAYPSLGQEDRNKVTAHCVIPNRPISICGFVMLLFSVMEQLVNL
jgi:hypothetical protein